MNFLSTLLAYMAATLVVAVESTATPSVTPVPTPSPTPAAAVVETVTEAPTLAASATPEATVSVTPVPVPTITPNTRAYHNLARGDKGDEVRRLQEKLIELGYLPEGSADGAYGNQTRMAVRRFQYYNSLTVDGVAGRATQTNLFENPDVMPYPSQETPTPEVTATPEPTEIPTVPPEETDEGGEAADVTEKPEETAEAAPAQETKSGEETAAPETETAQAEETETEAPAAEEESAAETAQAAAETVTEAPAAEEKPAAESTETAEETVAEAPAAAEEPAAETAQAAEETVTETPAPAADGEEQVEDVDLDALESLPTFAPTPVPEKINYEDVAGWVVLNDSGASMQWTELEDGVPVVRSPRLQRSGEDIRVSLDDLCSSVESWILTDEGKSLVLEAQGFILALLQEENGLVSTVDGLEMVVDTNDIDFGEGHYIRADFLCRALDGSWEWDEEEETLMLRIPEKNPDLYSD